MKNKILILSTLSLFGALSTNASAPSPDFSKCNKPTPAGHKLIIQVMSQQDENACDYLDSITDEHDQLNAIVYRPGDGGKSRTFLAERLSSTTTLLKKVKFFIPFNVLTLKVHPETVSSDGLSMNLTLKYLKSSSFDYGYTNYNLTFDKNTRSYRVTDLTEGGGKRVINSVYVRLNRDANGDATGIKDIQTNFH